MTAAYAAVVRAQAAILATLNVQIMAMEEQVEAHFGQHPDAEIYLSQPGLGVVLGARVLAEFGDDNARYADARARKNYAGTSPITRQSGKKSSCWPDTCTTTGSSTRSTVKRLRRCARHPAPAPTTTSCEPAASATRRRCANSTTGWSASCTTASRPEPRTTKTPPGPTASNAMSAQTDVVGCAMHSPARPVEGSSAPTGPKR